MYVYSHARARGECKGGPSAPSPATIPPVGNALRRIESQWIYAVGCKARSTLPTGGAEGPLLDPPPRARVCVYTYICELQSLRGAPLLEDIT